MDARMEEREQVFNENVVKLKEVLSTTESIISIGMDRTRKKLCAIEDRVKTLQEEKLGLISAPITKEELLERALAEFREQRREAINVFLVRRLKDSQSTNSQAFWDVAIRALLTHDNTSWRSFFFFISEAEIREAVDSLPEIGISKRDRESKIKQIDKEIAKQMDLLNEELEKAKKQ